MPRKPKPIVIEHEIRTRADLLPGVPFSLSCRGCDLDPPGSSLEAAILGGWTEIYADDGTIWNYIGLCPVCKKEGW